MQSRPNSEWTYRVREFAPSTVVLANIGIGQAQNMQQLEIEIQQTRLPVQHRGLPGL